MAAYSLTQSAAALSLNVNLYKKDDYYTRRHSHHPSMASSFLINKPKSPGSQKGVLGRCFVSSVESYNKSGQHKKALSAKKGSESGAGGKLGWAKDKFCQVVASANRKDGNVDNLQRRPTVQVVRYKPLDISELLSKTKFTKRELQTIYRGFKQECPTGTVNEERFKQIFSQQIFPQGDVDAYASMIFRTLDKNKLGCATFEEFVVLLSLLTRGEKEDKKRWCFELYDVDNDGYISRTDMTKAVTAVYDLLGDQVVPSREFSRIDNHVDYLFEKFDKDNDGVISFSEFAETYIADDHIERSLIQLDSVYL